MLNLFFFCINIVFSVVGDVISVIANDNLLCDDTIIF